MGKELPRKAIVHHVNGDSTDNRNTNLVVCPTQEYHVLLHVRTEALAECGNAALRKCKFCKEWDDPKNLKFSPRNAPYHSTCTNEYSRSRKAA